MGIMLINQGYNGSQLEAEAKAEAKAEALNKTWEIKGSTGNYYKRELYLDSSGVECNTCSCPSFTYCKSAIRTCKHI